MTGHQPPSEAGEPRSGIAIALIGIGAVLGFAVALIVDLIIGLLAAALYSADHPSPIPGRLLGALPGIGALAGAVLLPVLYVRGTRRSESD